MRLSSRFRFTLYGVFWMLLLTGAAWPVADELKDGASGELWQAVAADLLMLHGGAAMACLMLLGALVPMHVQRAWRTRRNRVTGSAMATANALLIVTAFGLYYMGPDTFRPWFGDVHLVIGFVSPVLFVIHVWCGRRFYGDQAAK